MKLMRRLLMAGVCLSAVPLFAGTLTFVNRSADAERHLTLRREGERLLLVDEHSQEVVASARAAGTDRVVIAGATGDRRDTLTLDLTEGITLAGGIDFDGGAGGWDSLVLRGGRVRNQRMTQLTPHDGVVDLDGLILRYTNLEPITDTLAAASYAIVGTAGMDTVSIDDGPGGTTIVSSPSFESVTFANKTDVVFDGLGGGDSVAFNNPNPATGLVELIVTNVDTVTQTGAIHYPRFGVNATGSVSLGVIANDVDNLEVTTQNGNLAFLDADDLTIGGVDPLLSGVRVTTAGSLDIRTQGGNLTLSDLDGAEILRSGNSSGNILLRVATAVLGSTLGINVDRDAAIAPAGSIDIMTGSILLGTAGPAVSNDIRAAGSIDLLAGSTLIVDGDSRVASDDFGTNSGGGLTARGFGIVEVRGSGSLGAAGTAGADASILSGGGGTVSVIAGDPAALFSTSGDLTLTTQILDIAPASGITVPVGKVTIRTFILVNGIVLGPTTDTSNIGIEISDAEIDRIFTPTLDLMPDAHIYVTDPITFTTGTELSLSSLFGSVVGSGTGSLSAQVLTVHRLNGQASTWTITPASLTLAPGGTPVPFTGVTTLHAISGNATDTFLVSPHPTTTIHVEGNDPIPASPVPGDTLQFDLTGVTNPVLTATLSASGYSGSLTSSNRAPVLFEEIESIVNAPVDLQITKSDGAASDVAGTTVAYTITVSNPGPIPIAGVAVNDTFPPEITDVSWTCAPSAGSICTANGTGNISQTVTIAAGGSVTYTATGTIAPSATGTLTNTATVTPPAGSPETNPIDNSATDTTTLSAEADLVLTKSASGGAAAGADITYTITLRNAGPSDSQTVTLTDAVPANTTFQSLAAPGSYSCTTPPVGGTGTVTCSTPTLAPSATPDTFTLVVRVGSGVAPGTMISNTATATSPTDATAGTATALAAVTASIPALSPGMLAMLCAALAFSALLMTRRT
jgi:uncharacterized repeat protein (TIGR01451 family)